MGEGAAEVTLRNLADAFVGNKETWLGPSFIRLLSPQSPSQKAATLNILVSFSVHLQSGFFLG